MFITGKEKQGPRPAFGQKSAALLTQERALTSISNGMAHGNMTPGSFWQGFFAGNGQDDHPPNLGGGGLFTQFIPQPPPLDWPERKDTENLKIFFLGGGGNKNTSCSSFWTLFFPLKVIQRVHLSRGQAQISGESLLTPVPGQMRDKGAFQQTKELTPPTPPSNPPPHPLGSQPPPHFECDGAEELKPRGQSCG